MGSERGDDFLKAMIGGAKALPRGWWLLTIAIAAATNAADFFTALPPGGKPGAAFAVSALVRVLLVFWLTYALLRRLAGQGSPMRVGSPFLRLVAFLILLAAVMAGAAAVAARITGDARSIEAALIMWGIMTAVTLAILRLIAWETALAVGDRELGPGGAWRALAGSRAALAAAYVPIAVLALAHSVMTRFALVPGTGRAALGGLALMDGMVSGAELVLGAALGAAAWRAARERAQPLRRSAAVA